MSKRRRDEDGAGVDEARALAALGANMPADIKPLVDRQAAPREAPDVRAAMGKLRKMWVATQPETYDNVSGVTLTRDEAAALYVAMGGT